MIPMTKKLIAMTLLLAGCAAEPASRPDRPDATALAAFAREQITMWNALGIDPFRADQRTLAWMAAVCGTVTSIAALRRGPDAGDDAGSRADTIAAFCITVARAAAPAA